MRVALMLFCTFYECPCGFTVQCWDNLYWCCHKIYSFLVPVAKFFKVAKVLATIQPKRKKNKSLFAEIW